MNRKTLLAVGLVSLFLPVTPVPAFEDTSRMDIVEAKVRALEEKAKASDSKIEALGSLGTKISQLEGRIDTSDSKMKYMVRQEAELEARVSALEGAQEETEEPVEKKSERTGGPALLTA